MLRYLLIITALMLTTHLFAQPGSSCANAETLSIGGTSSCDGISAAGAMSGSHTCSAVSANYNDGGYWYSFTGNGSTVTADFSGYVTSFASYYLGFEILSGTCGSFSCEDATVGDGTSNTTSASLSVATTAGVTYYIFVSSWDGNPSSVCVSLSSAGGSGGGATGTACSSAEAIAIGATDCGATTAAGSLSSHPCTGLGNYDDGGYWYSFTGDGSTVTLDLSGYTATSTGYWISMEVFSGACGSLSCEDDVLGLTGSTSSSLSIATTNGQQYHAYISIYGSPQASYCLALTSSGGGGGGTGTGNNCTNVVPLTIGVTDCATAVDNSGSFGNNSSSDNPCSGNYNDYEYWYSVTGTGDPLNITLSSIGATYTAISVLDDCPGSSPSCIAYADNGSSTTDLAITTPVLTNGATYYVVISTWESTTGTRDFCINTSTPTVTTPGGTNCGNIQPICTDVGLTFTANSSGVANVKVSEPGNNYGCLGTSPNPSWYYLEIGVNGDINMDLSAASDIDFALWGPFTNLAAAQASCGSLPLPVDCSYSASSTEEVDISGGQVGEVYVLLITNYASVVQDVTLVQSGGLGATNCAIVCGVDAGTTTVTMDNSSSENHVLCYDDGVNLNTAGAILPSTSDIAGLGYAVYASTPATSDPSTDPNFTGYYFNTTSLDLDNDVNNTYDFIIANPSPDAGSNGIPSGDSLVLVPITMDDIAKIIDGGSDDNMGHDLDGDGCFALGTPVSVVYLDDIVGATVETCGVNTVITLSGGYPGYDASSTYTVTSTGAGTMVQSGTQGQTLTFTELNVGEVITVNVTNDNNGCTKTITFTTTCATSSCNADAGSW